jgi:hypothetical protein
MNRRARCLLPGAPPTSPSTVTGNRGRAPRHDRTSPDAVDATAHERAPREKERDYKRYFPTRAYREFVRSGLNSPLGLHLFKPMSGSSWPPIGVVDNEAGSESDPGSSSFEL